MRHTLSALKGGYLEDYIWGVFKGLLRGILGVWTIDHVAQNYKAF